MMIEVVPGLSRFGRNDGGGFNRTPPAKVQAWTSLGEWGSFPFSEARYVALLQACLRLACRKPSFSISPKS